MTDKLKNCPFCNSNIIYSSKDNREIQCQQCPAKMVGYYADETYILLCEKWNTRAESENYKKLLEFIKEINNGVPVPKTLDESFILQLKTMQKASSLLKEIGELDENK